ncbi:MAG: CarD family transcriptional regulator [Hyphomonadaceae bacterium]|nr:CarD family transcriptional regulator [Hyphomonadaceae bacterium]
MHLASSERRAEEIARSLAGLAPHIEVIILPPWDCLPYDRASPSRDVMGRRLSALRRLSAKAKGARILVLSPEALVQRAPARKIVSEATFEIHVGEALDRETLMRFAMRTGHVVDDRIDEPGEIAVLGSVVDIFPADAAQPVRIVLGDGDVVGEIRTYDPLTQRSDAIRQTLVLGPASEWIADTQQTEADAPFPRPVGVEHRLPEHYATLESVFDLAAKASLSQDPNAAERLAAMESQILEAYEARCSLGSLDDAPPPAPERLYVLGRELDERMGAWTPLILDLDGVEATPGLVAQRNPGRAFCDLVDLHRTEGRRVVLTGLRHEQRALAKALDRGLGLKPGVAPDWEAARNAPVGDVVSLEVDLEAGFVEPAAALAVIAASDVLGGRVAARKTQGAAALLAEPDLRIGDVVLHEDHGVGVLRDLRTVHVDGVDHDTLQLEYYGGASLLAPVEEIGRIWRYGAEESAVTLDRLKGDAWTKRRAEVSAYIDQTAAELVALARVREGATCPPLIPPRAAYAKLAARFAYPETPDQAAAIEAVLADLASGRPMDRLICGDVGFGKTEVALRAAAAVALSGRQVAVAAPTTVLVRQHVETFERRFAGTGVKVGRLSRLVGAAEAKSVREGLASGEIGVVIGTQSLASDDVAFADLGLMIIDEEQKFGAVLKRTFRDLAAEGHLLTLTATPIPRTLQAAMVGLQDVSVIASPPARRRPIRTFLAPLDPASLRTALLREQRRGGQSFFVVPRIDDIEPMRNRLAEIAPELSVSIAHGGLSGDATDKVMLDFADGRGDVLLATNIIESGLDVPRANTMFVWRPDRFGLSQLHQLRGRVGRGRTQGVAYLLADPAEDLSEATRARLSTLEAFDRLGSGLAISARDLDLRGGGDLVGEEQAGHVRMVGAALYQRLLARAIRLARGEEVAPEWASSLNLGEIGSIPTEYVPDAVTRINLYARVARMDGLGEVDDFEEELEDRFGPVPQPTAALLALARLQVLARAAGVRAIGAGPKGIAVSLAPGAAANALARLGESGDAVSVKDDRLIFQTRPNDAADPLRFVERMLTRLVG